MSQAVDCCLETMVEQIVALGARSGAKFSSRSSRPISLMCRHRRKKEEEGIVKPNKSKTKPVRSWRRQRQVGAMKALQRAVWSLIFLGFGVHLAKVEEQGRQVQQRVSEKDLYETLPSRRPMEDDASLGVL